MKFSYPLFNKQNKLFIDLKPSRLGSKILFPGWAFMSAAYRIHLFLPFQPMPALLPWCSSPIHLAGKCHISFRFPKARAIRRGLWDKSLSMQWHSMWGGKLDMSPATALARLATICVTSYCLLWSFVHSCSVPCHQRVLCSLFLS